MTTSKKSKATSSEEIVHIGQVTETQIKAWEKQYGTIKEVIVFDEYEELPEHIPGTKPEKPKGKGQGRIAYFKKPSRDQASFFSADMFTQKGKPDMFTPGKYILRGCYVGGCEDLKHENISDKDYYKITSDLTGWLGEIVGFM